MRPYRRAALLPLNSRRRNLRIVYTASYRPIFAYFMSRGGRIRTARSRGIDAFKTCTKGKYPLVCVESQCDVLFTIKSYVYKHAHDNDENRECIWSAT